MKKFDEGKARYGLIPPHALEALARVLTIGAAKYGDTNWCTVQKHRYFDALQRHAWAWQRGEKTDPESGLSHMAHVLANAAFIFELEHMESNTKVLTSPCDGCIINNDSNKDKSEEGA